MGKVFCIVLILLALFLCFSDVSGKTWYIKSDSTGDAVTIQAGIDSAAAGDTVLLADGTYKGDGNRDIDYLGKAIVVRSENGNPDSCIIDCQGSQSLGNEHSGFYFHSGEGSGSVLEGVKIKNGFLFFQQGGAGITCISKSSPSIYNCILADNCTENDLGAFFCNGSSMTIMNCKFIDNRSPVRVGGVYCSNSDVSFINCFFINNNAYAGALYGTNSNVTIDNCQFISNGGACGLECWNVTAIVKNSKFVGNREAGELRFNDSNVTVINSDIIGNSEGGMYCFNSNFLITGCTFSDNGGLDGGGIRIHTSTGEILRCDFLGNYSHQGGGILCQQTGALIDSCSFHSNWGQDEGGGAYILDSQATISNCDFSGNSSHEGGGIYSQSSRSKFTNCIVSGNLADDNGAGIFFNSSNDTLINCAFIQNYTNGTPGIGGLGAYCWNNSNSVFINCTFYANAYHHPNGEQAESIYIENSFANIDKSIISFTNGGQAISCSNGGGANLSCSNVYGNAGGDWVGCIADQAGINGNISEDPLFCDPVNGNYYLSSHSPCLHGACGQIGAFGIGCTAGEPAISIVEDVTNDQGRQVSISWYRSKWDTIASAQPILSYEVFRRIDDLPSQGYSLDIDDLSANERGENSYPLLYPPGNWHYLLSVPAHGEDIYSVVVPTLEDSCAYNDSTETGEPLYYSVFFIRAATSVTTDYFDSPVDSGYSVDNLIPHLPTGFFGVGVIEGKPTGLKLSWDANRDPDIARYSLYKGLTEDFVPDETTFLASTDGNSHFDESWIIMDLYFYKLAAEDIHGNVSPYAVLGPAEIVIGVLLQSYNASYTNSIIEVTWTLTSPLEQTAQHILRAADQEEVFTEIGNPAIIQDDLTFTYRDGAIEPGATYKYRVEIEGYAGQRMLLFETGDIATPKLPLTLFQNVPNPFNPSTTITFYLPESCPVTLEIFDSSGKLISKLLNNEVREKGMNSIEWRGTDEHGRAVASGVYFYRLIAGKEIISKKMVLLK